MAILPCLHSLRIYFQRLSITSDILYLLSSGWICVGTVQHIQLLSVVLVLNQFLQLMRRVLLLVTDIGFGRLVQEGRQKITEVASLLLLSLRDGFLRS